MREEGSPERRASYSEKGLLAHLLAAGGASAGPSRCSAWRIGLLRQCFEYALAHRRADSRVQLVLQRFRGTRLGMRIRRGAAVFGPETVLGVLRAWRQIL